VTWARREIGSRSRSKSIFFMALAVLERTKIGVFVDCDKKTIEMFAVIQKSVTQICIIE
jgi:hypothetical protein